MVIRKIIGAVMTILSIVLLLIGAYTMLLVLETLYSVITGAGEMDFLTLLLRAAVSLAFLYTGKKLFIRGFYRVIQKS